MTKLPDGFTLHLFSAETEICNVSLTAKVTEHICERVWHFCWYGVKNADIKTEDELKNEDFLYDLNPNQQ